MYFKILNIDFDEEKQFYSITAIILKNPLYEYMIFYFNNISIKYKNNKFNIKYDYHISYMKKKDTDKNNDDIADKLLNNIILYYIK